MTHTTFSTQHIPNRKPDVNKLISLWAFSECALGGLLHSFKMPFSGLFLASFAVILIVNIGFVSKNASKDIIYGTIIALTVKAIVSPQTPFTAYIAVGFQGLTGALLFLGGRPINLFIILFGCIALLESSLQKILIMTLIYGSDIWNAFDATARQVISSFGIVTGQYTLILWLFVLYVLIYLVVGGLAGWWASLIPDKIAKIYAGNESNHRIASEPIPANKSKFRHMSLILFILSCLVLAVFASGLQGGMKANWMIVARPFLFIAIWYLIVQPLIKFLAGKLFTNSKARFSTVTDHIISQIPFLTTSAQKAWRDSSNQKYFLPRLGHFIVLLIVYASVENSNIT